ncbi:hypothetical protein ACIQC0_12675 [Pseudarthrobacter sp. NPDC092419]|uniref:hypothetical protein n=1 Tax=Pseudarthrobacter sp. NPDC092419 TaxID=3364414 RepID=UPI003800DF69
MDFPLSSSVILVVAVALWIVWVAPYVLRNRRQRLLPAGDVPGDALTDQTPDRSAGLVLNVAAQQEKAMDPRKSAGTAKDAATAPARRLRIRYGRMALALAGLLSLVTAAVSGTMLIFGLGSPVLPAACLAVTFLSVVILRRLAVSDRRRRVNAAFRSAMSAPAGSTRTSGSMPPKPAEPARAALPERPLFDAEAGQDRIKQLTAVELREAALAVALAAGDTSAPAQPAAASGTPWEPVEVPKPVYVEAAKAERPEPEPLALPEAPKAVGKPSLKQGAAPVQAGGAVEPRQLTKAQSALSNLDDVLQRRRA